MLRPSLIAVTVDAKRFGSHSPGIAYRTLTHVLGLSLCVMLALCIAQQTLAAEPALSVLVATKADSLQQKALASLQSNLKDTVRVKVATDADAKFALDEVSAGRTDIAVVPASSLVGIAPGFGIYTLDFAFSERPGGAFLSGEVPRELNAELRMHGLVAASRVWNKEPTLIAGNVPLRSPADFRGATIDTATTGTTPFEIVGAKILRTTRPPGEVLSSKAADGAEVTWHDLLKFNPRFVTLMNKEAPPDIVVYNLKRFMNFPTDVQSAVIKGFDQVAFAVSGSIDERKVSASDQVKLKKNITFLKFTETSRREWLTALGPAQRAARATIPAAVIANANEKVEYYNVSLTLPAGERIQWNAWFDTEDGTPTNVLKQKVSYQFVLDLGRKGYPGAMHDQADRGLIDFLEEAAHSQKSIRLIVRPVLIGGNLTPIQGSDFGAKTLVVDLRRADALNSDQKVVDDAQKKGTPPDVVSQTLSLASSLKWQVSADVPGCAQIGISIWDARGLTPLDYLAVTVPVARSDGSGAPKCRNGLEGGQLAAGLGNLLKLADASATAQRADVSIHFFDRPINNSATSTTVAVLIDRRAFEAAEKQGDTPPIYAWELKSQLSTFLTTPTQLQEAVAQARQNINSPQPFAEVVDHMSNAIFIGRNDDDRRNAEKAKAALKKLSGDQRAPIILTRYFDANGGMVYLPLALLGANSPNRILPRRAIVVQPLLNTPARRGKECFGAWDFAIPKKLDDLVGDPADLLSQTDWRLQGNKIAWYDDNTRLLEFVEQAGATTGQGEAMILLAHHGDGAFYFSAKDRPNRILNTDVNRRFAPGSVAVLAACSTVGGTAASEGLLNRLTENGMMSVVASPFQVDAPFGAQLAVNFVTVAKEAREAHTPTRLIDLFDKVMQRTVDKYKNRPGYADMALEFQIVGSYDVLLCAP
ncbi:hypothetical protein [Paraburkholderia graminis]|uniref:hypothetical protein n=1 Tax=Paraburkholderia graminis TaxID=60548 RepID=UPI0038B6C555